MNNKNRPILASVRRGIGLALLWAGLAAVVYVPTAPAGVTTAVAAALGFLSFAGGITLFANAIKQEVFEELRSSSN